MGDNKIEKIEDLAWQVFLNKTGFRFKSELTPEVKKTVTDLKDYDHYREVATKIYEKKEKALLNKKYPIIDVPASGTPTWMGGAYTLCFVYSKHNGNFVLRGYSKEVNEYLKKNYTHYFYNMSLWYQGFNRDIWGFWKENVGIFHPSKKKNDKIKVRPYYSSYDSDEAEEKVELNSLTFKRLPKRWIPEFDKL